MTVTELTKEICEKYPKVWEKLKEKYDEKYLLETKENDSFYYSLDNKSIIIVVENISFNPLLYSTSLYNEIPFPMLYGLLEDFFDMTGKVNLKSIYDNYFRVFSDRYIEKNKKILYLGDYVNIKNEAKQQAILKVCEIMENNLKKIKGD